MIAFITLLGAAGARVWRAIRSSVGAAGLVVLPLTAACLATWLVLRRAEFGAIGLTLLAALVISVRWMFGRSDYAVDLQLSPRRVAAGDTGASLRLVVRSKAEKSLAPLRMRVAMPGRETLEFGIRRLGAKEEQAVEEAIETPHRGVIRAGPVESVRGDPLRLLQRSVRWSGVTELFVHPRTVRLEPSTAGLLHDLEGTPSQVITPSDLSFHALRPYEPGDDPRFIHWGASAKATTSDVATLMVRQFEESRRSHLTLLLTTSRESYQSVDAFELAISVAASIARQVIRDGTDISFVTEDGPLDVRSETRFLDATSSITPSRTRFRSVRAFAHQRTLGLPDASVAILVGGSGLPPGDYRSIAPVFRDDTVLYGIRCGSPKGVTASEMRLVSLANLADLRSLLEAAT